MKTDGALDREETPRDFRTTQWNIVQACDAEKGNTLGREALGQLCRIYWRPIFAFICRRGYSICDAQDLTQDFFLAMLNGELLLRADPSRGRFRCMLLKGLQDFLVDATRRQHSLKRGGGVSMVSWDDWMAESPSQLRLPFQEIENRPPEQLFDLRWAATITEQALRKLAEECDRRGRRRVFDVLTPFLTTEHDDICYADLSRLLGVMPGEVKKLVYRLRQRFRVLLRREVAQTVEHFADVEEEIRYLCAALVTLERDARWTPSV